MRSEVCGKQVFSDTPPSRTLSAASAQTSDFPEQARHTVPVLSPYAFQKCVSLVPAGLIEGINSLVQAAKANARGYRSVRNLEIIVCLIAGKLDFKLLT
jgi:hypothetical protein